MSESEAAACLALVLLLDDDDKKRRGPTRKWVRRRNSEGLYTNLVQELLAEDTKSYREMMRMTYESFKEILAFIEPYITPKESGVMGAHQTISAAQRLVLTIRFLATGETYKSLSFQFRVSERTLSYIVDEVTKAITEYIGKEYIKIPSSVDDWNKISEKFASRWNFPNCIGAIDGKHILIRPPPGTGSEYFNYKKSFLNNLIGYSWS